MKLRKRDSIYEELLSRLISARYRFGEDIQVTELVSEFGTSRQPVLAALDHLASGGFVEIVPQVGCRVVSSSKRDVADFYLMFARLEGVMAELAATRRNNDQLTRIREINANVSVQIRSGQLTPEAYRSRNRDFHRTLHRMANSEWIDNLHRRFFDMSDFFIGQTIGFKPHMADAVDEHDAIISAIAKQQPETARVTCEQHITEVAKMVIGAMLDTCEQQRRSHVG